VVALVAARQESAAVAALTRRTALRAQVRVAVGAHESLPFRAARFTHVWVVEALPKLADPSGVLAAAHRVVRPGGHVAVQDLVLEEAATAPHLHGWRFATLAARVAAVEAAGFIDIRVRDASAEAPERSPHVAAAREQFLGRLRAEPGLAMLADERDALAAALAAGTLRVVQIQARRP
jgi:ubiquinone/menaquinone biosynthesis C-methylase UbiE